MTAAQPDPCGASCEPAEDATAEAAVTGGDLIARSEVSADLWRLAREWGREWGRDMDNVIVGSALMDAAAYFEGTL